MSDTAADLIVVPEAELDVADAYRWYEARRAGLGEEFLSAIDASIAHIKRNPSASSVVRDQYRRCLVRRFPYAVFYGYSELAVLFNCTAGGKNHKAALNPPSADLIGSQ